MFEQLDSRWRARLFFFTMFSCATLPTPYLSTRAALEIPKSLCVTGLPSEFVSQVEFKSQAATNSSPQNGDPNWATVDRLEIVGVHESNDQENASRLAARDDDALNKRLKRDHDVRQGIVHAIRFARLSRTLSRLHKSELLLDELRVSLAAVNARATSIREQLSSLKEPTITQEEYESNPIRLEEDSHLAKLERQRSQLSTKYTNESVWMQRILREILDSQRRVTQMPESVLKKRKTTTGILQVQLEARLQLAIVEKAEVEASLATAQQTRVELLLELTQIRESVGMQTELPLPRNAADL